MAKTTKKINNPKTLKEDFKESIERTKQDLKEEILKESLVHTVSKKCFEKYFKYDEQKCTLTPRNNPPLLLFNGFINYILTNPKLKEYREKELGIYQAHNTRYLSLIYNKLSSCSSETLSVERNLIKNEIKKLEIINNTILFQPKNRMNVISNLFSEEEIIEKIKDVIFENKTTNKIAGKTYNRNRKSECNFLVDVFIRCLEYCNIENSFLECNIVRMRKLFSNIDKYFTQQGITIIKREESLFNYFYYSHTVKQAYFLFKNITGTKEFVLIEACTKLDFAKKEVIFDIEKYEKLRKEKKRTKNVKLPD